MFSQSESIDENVSAQIEGAPIEDEVTFTGTPDDVPADGRFEGIYPSPWGIVPGIEFSLGARLTLGICNIYISGELGWETHYYFEAVRTVPFGSDSPQTIYANMGFSGPYAGFRVQF